MVRVEGLEPSTSSF